MNSIKRIAPIHMIAETRGKGFVLLFYVAIPLFALAGLYALYDSLFMSGTTSDGMMGLLCLAFCGGCGFLLCKGGNYSPNKSFFFYRLTKEGLKKYIIWGVVICIAFVLLMMVIDPLNILKYSAGAFISAIIASYYMNKSIMVHEDVDYETNMQLAELIGLEVDEKINASYQNFDSSNSSAIQENSNIFLVSDKKLFFAYFNGINWFTTIHKIGDIEKIGLMNYGDDGTSTYLKLVFTDETIIGVRLNLYDKLTSNPNLFVKRFLDTLDAYLLGYSISNKNSRRRVSVGATSPIQRESTQSSDNMDVYENDGRYTRQIDINSSIINELKQSRRVEPGRIIEL